MASTALERKPATWEEYQALEGDAHAEYIDGAIVMSPPPSIPHQRTARRLADLLDSTLPTGYETLLACAWRPGPDEFVPDVMVVRTAELSDPVRFTGLPVLCIEVVSSNRSNDYVTKNFRYAQAGLDHYWIFDPRDGQLDVLAREGTNYRLASEVVAGRPQEVSYGVGTAFVDVDELLR